MFSFITMLHISPEGRVAILSGARQGRDRRFRIIRQGAAVLLMLMMCLAGYHMFQQGKEEDQWLFSRMATQTTTHQETGIAAQMPYEPTVIVVPMMVKK